LSGRGLCWPRGQTGRAKAAGAAWRPASPLAGGGEAREPGELRTRPRAPCPCWFALASLRWSVSWVGRLDDWFGRPTPPVGRPELLRGCLAIGGESLQDAQQILLVGPLSRRAGAFDHFRQPPGHLLDERIDKGEAAKSFHLLAEVEDNRYCLKGT